MLLFIDLDITLIVSWVINLVSVFVIIWSTLLNRKAQKENINLRSKLQKNEVQDRIAVEKREEQIQRLYPSIRKLNDDFQSYIYTNKNVDLSELPSQEIGLLVDEISEILERVSNLHRQALDNSRYFTPEDISTLLNWIGSIHIISVRVLGALMAKSHSLISIESEEKFKTYYFKYYKELNRQFSVHRTEKS